MNVKKSVTTRIARYLITVIIFAGIMTTFALGIMVSNRSDAEQINVSGSLRYQSYRILHNLRNHPDLLYQDLREYRKSLHSLSLSQIDTQILVPKELKSAYHDLIASWGEMEKIALNRDINAYDANLADYVSQVDRFVFALQRFAERKLIITSVVIVASMLLIIALVASITAFVKKQVAAPLQQLTRASVQVQMRNFQHVPLDVNRSDELGNLAQAFTQMSSELSKIYSNLEERIAEKTQKLTQTNRTLSMLYHCSQALSGTDMNSDHLRGVMKNVMLTEHLRALELVLIADDTHILLGEPSENFNWQSVDVGDDNNRIGELRWQTGLPCPDPRTLENIGQMLGRSLYFSQTQRQQQQLLLMEERSIIARELHDSLAQVLSYLQIQLTLLKHNLNKDAPDAKSKSLAIIGDFEQALTGGYTQLRELLSTFRLTVQEANLKLALEQVIDSLRNQTSIRMRVTCSLPSHVFNAQQLVHVLQIVREAVLNAIKHSKANLIEVIAHTNEDGEQEIIIRDDGVGIPSLDEPEGHYGLRIMEERSRQLNAQLTIKNRPTGGTEVCIVL
ncbi:nitrate/nitrite two-component system sensor histidine kinase NarQ [Bisgaard Taxon 10/6]|uniref:nitrate/nitrite two-component system sensor histidine kinase NarQ n=1 Tax=Exercitatus varius TaxID=67857 RepID=UPI00294A9C76|nr:nitrate/nitrite two-component system sensor histidine kinase NarQ [Exercitatus varius]MDG2955123.1 nitrate/nitrite two-component system sensor histidine kinase NarQ [Exercitatus varius]